MLIIDGDYPIAPGAMRQRRDVTLAIEDLRRRDDDPENVAMASLPELRRTGIAAALAKIASDGEREGHTIKGDLPSHRAYAIGRGQLAYYEELERMGEVRVLRTASEFHAHMAEWDSAAPRAARERLPVGLVLGLEGADSVVSPDRLDEWWDGGVRVISLGHYGVGPYAHGTGTGTDGDLRPGGEDLLRNMDRLGMILDVTHTSDIAVRQSLAIFEGPLLASHSNARALAPGERQLPDDLLRAVIERDGVVGSSMDTFMIYPAGNVDWGTDHWPTNRSVFPREAVTLEDFVNHIDYVCDLAGNSRHAGIGGDTDGQGGREAAPHGIDTVADYLKIADVLRSRGYAEPDVENVMWRNWQRLFERTLPA